jgi:hypothetical protein
MEPREESCPSYQGNPAKDPASITILKPPGHAAMQGVFVDIWGSGTTLRVPRLIPCGGLLKIETEDALMLGEVVLAEPDGTGFQILVTLRHVLPDFPVLRSLNQALLAEQEDANASSPVRRRITGADSSIMGE